jgi:flagellar hook-associated protein 2
MAIGFSGIGAGADWNSIINQLMQIESQPLTRLQSRESDIDQQISDFGRVKSSIDTFQSAIDGLRDGTSFALFSGVSTDDNVLTLETSSAAAASSYDVVVTQLASNDKIASSAYADSTTTAVGTGSLSFTVNGQTMNLTVDGSNNTLAGLRDAINNASDNPGVTATILNEVSGSRLILTSTETGTANAISIGVVDADDGNNADSSGLSRLFYIGAGGDGLAEQISTAQDALLTIDGFDIESTSNSVTDAISGVTLQLASIGSASIDIERDNSQIEEKISGFVDAYNSLMDDFETFQVTSLENDSGLRRMRQGFVDILNQAASLDGANSYLFEIGITRDKLGKLSLDSAELTDALAGDFNKVSQLFSDDATGFATRFYDFADQLLGVGGIIDSRSESLDSQKRSVQTQIERQQLHLDVYEKTLVEQFMSLDQTMATLQNTSSYLSAQLSNL